MTKSGRENNEATFPFNIIAHTKRKGTKARLLRCYDKIDVVPTLSPLFVLSYLTSRHTEVVKPMNDQMHGSLVIKMTRPLDTG